MALVDQHARDQIRTDLDGNMVVEAAAGTGKTSELVQRIIAVLAEGRASIDRIIAVTFTEKAAGELKLRLRSELERARAQSNDSKQTRYLEQALAHLEEARVSTIHALCADLLRERPVEARIDPQFEVMTEVQSQRLYRQAFGLWFERKLENLPEGIRRFLQRRSRDSATEALFKAGWELAGWRDFPTRWRRDAFARQQEIDRLVGQLHAFADLTKDPDRAANMLFADTAPVRSISDEMRTLEATQVRDYDGLEAMFVSLVKDRDYEQFRKPHKGYARYKEGVSREDVLTAHAALLTAVPTFFQQANADLAPLLQAELTESVSEYQSLKERSGQLDFLDLLIRMRDLLINSESVRIHFQHGYSHIFVDEFQDTDPLQAEILVLLAADNPGVTDWRKVTPVAGKLFIVGDPKQAIYRFRRADVGTYDEVKKLLLNRGASFVELTSSFRSLPSIQCVVNESFAAEMDGDPRKLQARYVPLSPFRPHYDKQPATVALPAPRPYGTQRFSMDAVEKSLPDSVAAFVDWLVRESGWTVPDRENSDNRIPISASHVCLLFRRLYSLDEDVVRPYIRALEARNLPHLLVGGRSFHEREEVQTVRAALAAIEWPGDELSVFATLRGSLFAIPDDLLLEFRHRYGRFHPFRVPAEPVPDGLRPVADALGMLRELHRGRNYQPVAETVELLLRRTRAHLAFVLRPSGEQVLANVLHISELARKYEASGGLSFRGFCEALQEGADAAETGEAPIFEEGGEGIRIMSVHRAKGLEFPVVILADITAKISLSYPSRHIDAPRRMCAIPLAGCEPRELQENAALELVRDRAEGVRVAYVASTRARDLLVVPTIGDHPFGKWDSIENWWVRPLYRAVYPPLNRYRKPAKADACPKFGTDSVLWRPDNSVAEDDNVCPGRHCLGSNGSRYDVTWWDPQILNLDVRRSFGIRLEELLARKDPKIAEQDLEKYKRWSSTLEEVRANASKPTHTVRTATSEVRREKATHERFPQVDVVELPRDGDRPAGPRFGTLVHAALATVALDATAQQAAKVATLQGRILSATEQEVTVAAHVVHAALSHPLLVRAREAGFRGQCRREVPVTLPQPDGTIVEGVIDLAFLENNSWTVVDFKTDRELENGLEHYRRQVELYCAAVAAATGQQTCGILIHV
jgi:ATP-dependent helicase/nuclease subunit A